MKIFSTIVTLLALSTNAHAITPHPSWADSYSVDGVCYIESTFDHGAGDLLIDTPQGPKTAREIADVQFKAIRPYKQNNPIYNDVACGHGPANNAGDEVVCPGRVDLGEAGCQIKGPRINVEELFPSSDTTASVTPTLEPPIVIQSTNDQVTVIGQTLAIAVSNYAAATQLPRKDCDPTPDGRWLCSSESNPQLSDISSPEPVVLPEQVEPPVIVTPDLPVVVVAPTVPAPSNNHVTVVGRNLVEARALYAQATTQPTVDCDPTPDGRWLCSSKNNPQLSDVTGVSTTTPTPGTSTTEAPTVANPEPTISTLKIQAENGRLHSGAGWSIENGLAGAEGNYIVWRGADDFRADDSNPPAGILAYDLNVTTAGIYKFTAQVQSRVGANGAGDSDNDGWIKFTSGSIAPGIPGDASKWTKFFQGGAPKSWSQYSSGEQYDPTFFTDIHRYLPIGQHTVLIGGRSQRFAIDYVGLQLFGQPATPTQSSEVQSAVQSAVQSGLPSDSLYSRGDFVSVHFDTCPDADDLHAATATKMVLGYYDLNIDTDFAVVNGACGWDRPRNDYNTNSPQLFNHVYGNEGSTATWLNAYTTTPNTVKTSTANTIAGKWQTALEAGRKVWVLDGGPHDFTAVVIQILENNGINASLKNINVVQHSKGWNAVQTNDSNLALVVDRTTYHEIDNGNLLNNSTAGLNQNNSDNYYPNVDQALVTRFRNDARYGSDWAKSFTFVNPANRIDFSDTTEALHIFGLNSTKIYDIADFADKFLGQ